MSRNTEATDDVKTWTGGPLNFLLACKPMSWPKALMKKSFGLSRLAAMSRSGCWSFV